MKRSNVFFLFKPKRIVQVLRGEGLSELVKKAIGKILCLNRFFLICLSLDESLPDLKSKIPLIIRKVIWEDLDKLREIYPENPNSISYFSEWLKKGYYFFIALDGEKIVGYSCNKPIDQSSSKVFSNIDGIKKSEIVEGRHPMTIPEYRGKRVYAALSTKAHNFLKEKGYKKKVALVKVNNYSARIAQRRVGFKEIALVTYLKVLGFSIFLYEKDFE